MEVVLLPPPARGVVVEDASLPPPLVEPAEQRNDHEPLDRHRQVAADHLGEPVGLALQREPVTRDLLVVLELELEQLDDLDGLPGCAGDRDHGEIVRREDLLHPLVSDGESLGGPAVTAEHHTRAELQRDDRRSVRGRDLDRCRRRREGLGTACPDQVEEARVRADRAARGSGRERRTLGHSPPFWTYDLTNSSAFSSSTESISSRMSSISSLSFSPLEAEVT